MSWRKWRPLPFDRGAIPNLGGVYREAIIGDGGLGIFWLDTDRPLRLRAMVTTGKEAAGPIYVSLNAVDYRRRANRIVASEVVARATCEPAAQSVAVERTVEFKAKPGFYTYTVRVPDLPPDGGVAVRAGLEEQRGVMIERTWFVEGWRSLWRLFRGGTHVPRFP